MGDSDYTGLSMPLYSQSSPKPASAKRAAAKWVVGISGLAIFGYFMSTSYFSAPEASPINLNSSDPRLQERNNEQQFELFQSHLQIASFEIQSRYGNRLALSNDNSLTALVDYQNNIQLYNSQTYEAYGYLSHAGKRILAIKITKDKKYLLSIAAYDNFIQVWDLETKTQYGEIQVEDFPSTLLVTEDGQLAITRTERSVTVWDIKNLSASYSFDKYYGIFNDISLTHDGKYLAIGYYGGWIKVFDMSTKNEISSIYTGAMVDVVGISSDGKILTSYNHINKTAKFWIAETGELISMNERENNIFDFGLSPDGKKVFLHNSNGTFEIYYPEIETTYLVRDSIPGSFFFTKDSNYFVYAEREVVRILNLEPYGLCGSHEYPQRVNELHESEDSNFVHVLLGEKFELTDKTAYLD